MAMELREFVLNELKCVRHLDSADITQCTDAIMERFEQETADLKRMLDDAEKVVNAASHYVVGRNGENKKMFLLNGDKFRAFAEAVEAWQDIQREAIDKEMNK